MYKIGVIERIHNKGLELFDQNKKFQYEIIDDISKENLIKQLPKFDGLTLRVANLGPEILQNCKKLKVISRHGVGYDNVDIDYIDAEKLDGNNYAKLLKNSKGVIVPGGFGDRGIEGKINAIKFCRENKVPFLGICLGMQAAVIEFSRNVCNLKNSNSTEFNKNTEFPVIALIEEWLDKKGSVEHRDVNSNIGGTMRLGEQECKLKKDSNVYEAYKLDSIFERHRHRYEFNNEYKKLLEKNGLIISGISADGTLVEVIELKDHPWFLGCQFHPEFTSKPVEGHPLFMAFINSIKDIK